MEDKDLLRKISKGQPLRNNNDQFQVRKPQDPVLGMLIKQINKEIYVQKKSKEILRGTLRAVQPSHLGIIIEQELGKKKTLKYIRGDAIEEISIDQA